MNQNEMKKNVIVCGKGSLAIKISNWFLKNHHYNLLYVIPVIPEKTWTKSFVEWAKKNKIKIITSGDFNDIPELSIPSWQIDLVVSVFYEKIFTKNFIKRSKKIINLHNAPLPKYRGVSPINWALKNNERTHGVTIHEVKPGIDDGPIIAAIEYSIYPNFDTVESVYKRALKYGWILFKETMPIIDKIKPRIQVGSKASYYSKKENKLLGKMEMFKSKNF